MSNSRFSLRTPSKASIPGYIPKKSLTIQTKTPIMAGFQRANQEDFEDPQLIQNYRIASKSTMLTSIQPKKRAFENSPGEFLTEIPSIQHSVNIGRKFNSKNPQISITKSASSKPFGQRASSRTPTLIKRKKSKNPIKKPKNPLQESYSMDQGVRNFNFSSNYRKSAKMDSIRTSIQPQSIIAFSNNRMTKLSLADPQKYNLNNRLTKTPAYLKSFKSLKKNTNFNDQFRTQNNATDQSPISILQDTSYFREVMTARPVIQG